MNLAEARADLRKKVGNPTVANVPNSELDAVLNTAYSFITARYAFNQTRKLVSFQTTIGQDRYTLPPDFLSIRRIWDDTNKRKLRRKGTRFLSTLPLNLQAGEARYYAHEADWIQIVPPVNAVRTMYLSYIVQPAKLIADGDTPILPPSWHDGWVLKARHIYYDDRGDVGKAIYAKNEFKDWVSDKPSEIDQEKDDLDDAAIELPELAGWRVPRRDMRFDPLFDYTD